MNKMKIFVTIGILVILFFVVGLGVSVYTTYNSKADLSKVETIEPLKCEGDDVATPEPEAQEETVEDEINQWIEKYFSAEKVAMYFSYILYIGTIIGLVANIKKLKATNNLTLKNVSDDVKKTLTDTLGEEVVKQFETFLPNILATQEKTNKIMSIFAKILALSQENTPESRVAILDLIEELGVVSKEIVENAKVVVEEGQKALEQHKKEMNDKCDEIIEKYDGTSI